MVAEVASMSIPELLTKAFGITGIERVSISEYDHLIAQWLCSKGFDGYVAPQYEGFEAEVMVCPSAVAKLTFVHTLPVLIKK